MMKNLLFTLMMLVSSSMLMAQGTYYWVGTTPTTDYDATTGWNTATDGTGIERAAYNAEDILIVDGKTVQINCGINNASLLQLQVIGGANVAFIATNTAGNINVTFLGNETIKGLHVAGGSTLTIRVNTPPAGMNIRLPKGGDIDNSTFNLGDPDNLTTLRFVTHVTGGLVFKNGSICNYAANGGFGQHNGSVPTGPTSNNVSNVGSVVFESGTRLNHLAGTPGPFGNNTIYSTLNLSTGSDYYYKAALANINLLRERTFGHLIIDEGASYIANTNGDVFTSAQSLRVKKNATLKFSNTNTDAVTATIGGDVVVEEGATLEMNAHVFDLGAYSFTTESGAILTTSNIGGIDACIQTTGTKTFHANTIYGFSAGANDVAISTLLPADVPTENGVLQIGGIMLGNYRYAADKSINIAANGKLYINGGNGSAITLGANNLTLQPGVDIQRAENSNSRIWAHQTGTLSVLGIVGAKLIPVGTNGVYAPVILNTESSSDFSVKVTSASIAGTDRPSNYVAGINTITRTSGTGNFTLTLTWPAGWENADFGTLADNNISLYAYDGTNYTIVPTQSADNTANTITATLSNNGGIFIVGEGPNTLPVELISFTAQKQGNSVNLKWSTASENNNSHFIVERSADGVNFTAIGRGEGAGNSTTVQNYAFTDNNPVKGDNYYRLVQYDLDNKANLHGVQVVNFSGSTQGLSVQTNQNMQEVTFYVNSVDSGLAQVTVYAIDGKKLAEGKVNINKGNNTCTLNTPSLGKGIHTLVYQLGSESYQVKFAK